MRGLTVRLGANLLFLVLFSITIVIGMLLRYATGVAFDDSYLVSVELPEAGGVLPSQEVTVMGRAVGQVEDVRLSPGGVQIDLSIQGEHQVPAESTVQVLRRSPIGEQAVDFQPDSADWVAAEEGDQIVVTEAIVPAQVPFLLEQTVELFSAIDTDDLGTVIHELAVALEGRGQTLVTLGRDSLDLNRTLVAGIPRLERLNTSSAETLDTLVSSAGDLSATFREAADLAEMLADEQATLESLLTTSPVALSEGAVLIEDQSANLGCLMDDLIAFNGMMNGPTTWDGTSPEVQGRYRNKLHEAERALQLHRSFFQKGFAIVAQPDYGTGLYWNRIDLQLDEEGGGQRYAEKRATPTTLPGAACVSSEFGLGVNAVFQADVQPPDPTAAAIKWAPQVDGERSRGVGVVPPTLDGSGGGGLAATGGGAMLAAPLLLGLALVLRRRR